MNEISLTAEDQLEISSLELKDACGALLSVLKREIEVYRQLETAIEEESRILVKPALGDLHEVNGRKETILLKAKILEDARTKIVRRLARGLKLEEGEINLSLLARQVDGETKSELEDLQRELNGLAATIYTKNEKNKHLIEMSLVFVRNSISFINRMLAADYGYTPAGDIRAGNLQGNLIKTQG